MVQENQDGGFWTDWRLSKHAIISGIIAVTLSTMFLVVGVAGNILTIVTIAHARRMNREGRFYRNYKKVAIFIVNLAVADLVFCLFELYEYGYAMVSYFSHQASGHYHYYHRHEESMPDHDHHVECQIFVIGHQLLAQFDGWAIALIAFTKAMHSGYFQNFRHSHHVLWKWFTSFAGSSLMCLLSLILPVIFFTGVFLEKDEDVQYRLGTGNGTGFFCYTVEHGQRVSFSEMSSYAIVIQDCLILDIVVISFLLILVATKMTANELKLAVPGMPIHQSCGASEQGTEAKAVAWWRDYITHVEGEAAQQLAVICILYIVLRLPLVFLGRRDMEVEGNFIWFSIGVILYNLQFSINIFIYASLGGDFKNAYLKVLQMMLPCCQIIPFNQEEEEREEIEMQP